LAIPVVRVKISQIRERANLGRDGSVDAVIIQDQFGQSSHPFDVLGRDWADESFSAHE
jgi:hypothetical protein